MLASDSVVGVLAGHLHDSHKEIYRQPYEGPASTSTGRRFTNYSWRRHSRLKIRTSPRFRRTGSRLCTCNPIGSSHDSSGTILKPMTLLPIRSPSIMGNSMDSGKGSATDHMLLSRGCGDWPTLKAPLSAWRCCLL